MNKIKNLMSFIIAAALVSIFCCACTSNSNNTEVSNEASKDETKNIVFVSRGMSDMYAAFVAESFENVAKKDYPNYKVTILDLDDDFSKNGDFIDTAISMGADAVVGQFLLVDPVDAARRALEEGVPVVCIDELHEDSYGKFAQVTADNYAIGEMVAEAAAEVLPENAKVGIISITTSPITVQRDSGIRDKLAELRADVEIVDQADCDYDKNTAIQIATDWITEYGQLDGILGDSDTCALGAIEAYRAAGLDISKTVFYGVDGGSDGCYSIKQGEMAGSVLQSANEYASKSLDICQQYFDGKIDMKSTTEQPHITITPVLITSDNVDEYIEMYTEAGVMK